MATITVTHSRVAGSAANPNVLVDGPAWDEAHVVAGLENVVNLDTSNADNITGGLQTGAGALVRANNPTLTTPALGTPSAAVLTHATGLPVSTGISGLGTGVATALAVNVGSAGAPVVNGGALGTPSSGTLTNATGLPVATGISGLGSGVATFLATPSSANLRSALTDETGTGSAVFATSPTITTPVIQGITNGTGAISGQVGELQANTVALGAASALTTNVDTVWNTISLSAGLWLVGGTAGLISTDGATFTHMHADHNATGLTTVQTAPGGGSTTALHITSNQQNGWLFPMGVRPYFLSSPATVNAVIIGEFTGGTAKPYGYLWGLRIA